MPPTNLIKTLRTKLGLTQSDFAEMINLSQANCSKLENDRLGISLSVAQLLNSEFAVPMPKLFKENDRIKELIQWLQK